MSGARQLSVAERLRDAQIELKVAKAQLADLAAKEASGELIDRKWFEDRAFAFFRGHRDRLLGMSARHAAVLASRTGVTIAEAAAAIDEVCHGRINQLIGLVADHPVFVRALTPDPVLTVSQWADQHRVLSSRDASEAGPYRVSRTPYLREIMDCLSVTDTTTRRVVFQKAAQIGATEAGNCWLGYIIDHAPGPVLAVQPTTELAKRFSKQRIDPLIEESPRLRERVMPARSRDSGNTVLMKEFTGGVLIVTGANSAVGLRSMPARYLFLDEADAWPGDVNDEGAPLTLAEARTRTFSYRAKTFLVSTPRIKGTSVIAREYERSDQRKYFVPCPHCGHRQVLVFDRLKYEKEHPEAARYECEACAKLIEEGHKTDMLAKGGWQATAESSDPTLRGYHLSGLYSPVGWLSWGVIATQWEQEASQSVDARKGFINTILGEAYEEEASPVPEWERLYERREEWPHRTVPRRGLFLTAGADVQQDRIEVDVWAWGRGLESWLIEHCVLEGDPSRGEVWQDLDELLSKTWPHEGGQQLQLSRLAIDTGAFTQSVYLWARRQSRATVLPVKGMPAYDRIVPVSGPTRVEVTQNGQRLKSGLNLWNVSVSFFKRELYRQLELGKPTDEQQAAGIAHPAGYVHLSTATSDEWVKQLVAEQPVVVRSRHGFAIRTEWRPLRHRNEALDMRTYARAAAWLARADGWREWQWRGLEDQLGLSPTQPTNPPPPPKGTPAPPQPPRGPVSPSPSPYPHAPRPNRRVGYSRW